MSNETESREAFNKWFNSPTTNRRLTDLPDEQAYYIWKQRDDEVNELREELAHYKRQLDLVCEEGLTPADAKKLRMYNHGLADENTELRAEVERLKDAHMTFESWLDDMGAPKYRKDSELNWIGRTHDLIKVIKAAKEPT